MIRVLIALALGLLVGLLVGFVAFGDDDAEIGASVSQGARPERRRMDASFASIGGLEVEKAESAPDAEVDAAVAIATAEDAIESGETPADAGELHGDGVIQGTVVDAAGRGVAGALVRVELADTYRTPDSDVDFGAPKERALDDLVRERMRPLLIERASRRETKTDASGAYRIEGLPRRPYTVKAFARGYRLSSRSKMRTATPDSVFNFRGVALASTPIEVKLPDGRVAACAKLEISGDNVRWDEMTVAWSPETPDLALTAGKYGVRAVVEKDELAKNAVDHALSSERTELTITEGAPHAPVVLRLESRRGIRGRVTFPDDNGIESGAVVCAPSSGGASTKPDRNAVDAHREWVSPESERFEFLDLAPGRWAIGVSRDWNASIVSSRMVEVRDRVEEVELVLAPISQSESFVAHVVDEKGQPVPGVSFAVRETKGMDWVSSSNPVGADAGTYIVIPNGALDGAMSGVQAASAPPLLLLAYAEGFATGCVALASGQREATITLGSGAKLRLAVTNVIGGPFEGRLRARVQSTGADGRVWWTEWNRVSTDGTAELTGLPTRRVTLIVSAAPRIDDYEFGVDVLSRTLELASGDNSVTLSVPPVQPLRMRIGSADGARVTLQRDDADTRMESSVSNGVAAFDDLIAGDYTAVVTRGADVRVMRVRLPCDPDVEFVAEAPSR